MKKPILTTTDDHFSSFPKKKKKYNFATGFVDVVVVAVDNCLCSKKASIYDRELTVVYVSGSRLGIVFFLLQFSSFGVFYFTIFSWFLQILCK